MPSGRLLALDRLRGLVMVLMAIDHAGASMDAGHFATDSSLLWTPGGEIPGAAFFTRWITHFCAPTFVFLAGTSMALSGSHRRSVGSTIAGAGFFTLRRGLFIAALDPTFMSLVWTLVGQKLITLQVLYAIGVGMVAMTALRRLPVGLVAGLGLAYLVGAEWIVSTTTGGLSWGSPLWAGLLTQPAYWVEVFSWDGTAVPGVDIYPLLPWLAIMMLGWAFGVRLVRLRALGRSPVRTLTGCGLCALVVFAVVRGLNGYGNMFLLRDDTSLGQWMHVSKYPPSLSFAAMTLGGMALALAALVRVEERASRDGGERTASLDGPLIVFGQSALFFYILHFVVILGFARWSGLAFGLGGEGGGLAAAWWGGLGACAVLYLPCRWYRGWKRAHPDGWARYV